MLAGRGLSGRGLLAYEKWQCKIVLRSSDKITLCLLGSGSREDHWVFIVKKASLELKELSPDKIVAESSKS
jgi:hypothetical protein